MRIEKNINKTFIIFLVVLFIIAMSISSYTYAESSSYSNYGTLVKNIKMANQIAEPDTLEPQFSLPTCTISIFLARSGDTSKVEVYVKYIGFYDMNYLKMTSLVIMNKSQSRTFKTFKNVSESIAAGKIRYLRIGTVSISNSIKTVYVKGTGIRIYQLKKGWTSSGNVKGTTKIG